MFKNKTLLITGGTGSFGNAVLNRFVESDIKEIRIFSRDEKKQDEMRHLYNSSKIKFYVGDVRDYDSIDNAMHGVDFFFSAAALKQVPSCEFYPLEAVKTNILGTQNTIKAGINNNAKNGVILSTDKAVYPINAMGMSKALMEKVTVAMSRNLTENQTILSNTRYGNVMASRGSVIPHFINQIKNNSDITITDPDMTRFIMSLEQSVDLVLYAFSKKIQGTTYIQKAPATTIINLAEALIEIFGYKKSKIKIIGTRHGEKKHECLVSREEMTRAVDFDQFYCIMPDSRDLNYEKYFNSGEKKITDSNDYTSENTHRLSKRELIDILMNLDYVKNNLK